MEIKTRIYPYPILAYYAHDFKDGSVFEVNPIPEIDGFRQKVTLTATLTNSDLQQMLDTGKAEMIYHLECAQTGYRGILPATGITTTYEIPEVKVSGRLQICPFIIAKEDIPKYTNSDFEEDLQGMFFSIEQGNILALAKQINVKVKKKTDDLRNLPSIINIVLNADAKEDYMIVNYDGNLINVMLPDEEWNRVETLANNPKLASVFNCMIAVPTISYVLSKLQKMTPSERQNFDDDNKIWYDCIKRSLLKNFNIDVEGNDFENMDSFKLAQQLVNGPLNDALKALATGGDE